CAQTAERAGGEGRGDDRGDHEDTRVPRVVVDPADIRHDRGEDRGREVEVDGMERRAPTQRYGAQEVGAPEQVAPPGLALCRADLGCGSRTHLSVLQLVAGCADFSGLRTIWTTVARHTSS